MQRKRIEQGRLLALMLAGAWRVQTEAAVLTSDQLSRLTPLLLASGAGSLAWWRLRPSRMKNSQPGWTLRQAYLSQALAIPQEENILADAFRRLRDADVEPILIKGWAAARLYPTPALRPSSDIDLCVDPQQLPTAERVLTEANGKLVAVELHEGVPDVTDRNWSELFGRSRLLPLGESEVRVLGPEDQLRQLCLHFWRHNAYRPLWLCDIAAAMEQIPPDFDWDYFLTGNPVLVQWTLGMMSLACHLLGARLARREILSPVEPLPPWLLNTVLWQWGNGMARRPFRHYLRNPSEVFGTLYHQWFNPLRTTFRASLPPGTPLAFLPLFALLQQPIKLGIRLRRIVETRIKKWSNRPEAPYNLHLKESSRYL